MNKWRNCTSVREFMALDSFGFQEDVLSDLALDYSDGKRKDHLSSWCKVGGIPSFVVFDKNGTLITRDGRAAVSGDPTGDHFPWYPT